MQVAFSSYPETENSYYDTGSERRLPEIPQSNSRVGAKVFTPDEKRLSIQNKLTILSVSETVPTNFSKQEEFLTN